MEQVRLGAAHGDDRGPFCKRRQVHRAHGFGFFGRQSDVRLQLRVAMRLDVKQPAQRRASLDQVFRQAALLRPVGRDHHPGEMAAGRVAGYVDPFGIAVVLGDVLVDPDDRAPHLVDDVCYAHLRAEIVIGQHYGSASRDHRPGDVGVDVLVKRAPVATVNEHVHRCALARGGKDIERLPWRVPVRHVDLAGDLLTQPGTARCRFLQVLLRVIHRETRQVLEIDVFDLRFG